MRKGTVLYVGNFELPDKGASANRVVSNGKLLESLGYQVVFLGVRKGGDSKNLTVLDETRHMYEEPYPKGSKEWFLHMYSTKYIQELSSKYPDFCMILLYNVPYTLLWNTKRVFAKKDILVAYDCTEWTGVTDGSMLKRIVKRADEYLIRNRIGKVADGLMVISCMMEKQYEGQVPVVRIPPLIDLKDEIWHQETEKKEVGYEFCFAGMLDGNKESLDRIVEAFSKLEDSSCILRIIGVEREEFCQYYPEMRASLDSVKERILFMGKLSHKETIRYVLGCDCYIFIRQSDRRNNAGFPTKFAESFTCGMPIITTDISDLRIYMEKDSAGQLLVDTSEEKLRIAMMQELRTQSGKKERKLRQDFHYETYRKECAKWLEQVEIQRR